MTGFWSPPLEASAKSFQVSTTCFNLSEFSSLPLLSVSPNKCLKVIIRSLCGILDGTVGPVPSGWLEIWADNYLSVLGQSLSHISAPQPVILWWNTSTSSLYPPAETCFHTSHHDRKHFTLLDKKSDPFGGRFLIPLRSPSGLNGSCQAFRNSTSKISKMGQSQTSNYLPKNKWLEILI